MEDVRSVEFAVKAVFTDKLFGRIEVFSLQTIKGRALCFSTKKSTVRVVL